MSWLQYLVLQKKKQKTKTKNNKPLSSCKIKIENNRTNHHCLKKAFDLNVSDTKFCTENVVLFVLTSRSSKSSLRLTFHKYRTECSARNFYAFISLLASLHHFSTLLYPLLLFLLLSIFFYLLALCMVQTI